MTVIYYKKCNYSDIDSGIEAATEKKLIDNIKLKMIQESDVY